MRFIVTGLLVATLAACVGSDGEESSEDAATDNAAEAGYAARQAVYSDMGTDSDGTHSDADQVDASDVEDSGDYSCTQDCSGHEAGFSWAQENDLTDESECGGRSQSFIEGCEAFTRDRQEQADQLAQQAANEAAESAEAEYSYDSGEEYE